MKYANRSVENALPLMFKWYLTALFEFNSLNLRIFWITNFTFDL